MSAPEITAPTGLRPRLWSEVTVLGMALMEVIWVATWYRRLVVPQRGYLVLIVFLAFAYLGSSYLSRGMQAARLKLAIRRWAFIAWVLFVLYFGLRQLVYPLESLGFFDLIAHPFVSMLSATWGLSDFWHLIIVGGVIARGVAVARFPVYVSDVNQSLQFGLILLVIYGLGSVWLEQEPVPMINVYLFLFAGLIAMSAARISALAEHRGGRLPRFGLSWSSVLIISALGVVALAALAAFIIKGQTARILTILAAVVFTLAAVVVTLVISPLLALLIWAIPRIFKVLENVFAQNQTVNNIKTMTDELLKGYDPNAIQKVFDVAHYGRIAAMVGGVGAVVGVVLLLLKWVPAMSAAPAAMEAGLIRAAPLALLKPLLDRLGGRGRLNNAGQLLAAAQVRRVYAHLMALCDKLGSSRPTACTPLEFLPELDELFPDHGPELRSITQAYLRVRYGELPENVEEVHAVQDAWEDVRAAGRRELLRRKKSQTRDDQIIK